MTKRTRLIITAAAIAGLYTGALATKSFAANDEKAGTSSSHDAKDKSSCKGKDGCKGKDSCKGHESCKGKNDCKGKGGCGSSDNGCKGKNSCKGKGGCGPGAMEKKG